MDNLMPNQWLRWLVCLRRAAEALDQNMINLRSLQSCQAAPRLPDRGNLANARGVSVQSSLDMQTGVEVTVHIPRVSDYRQSLWLR